MVASLEREELGFPSTHWGLVGLGLNSCSRDTEQKCLQDEETRHPAWGWFFPEGKSVQLFVLRPELKLVFSWACEAGLGCHIPVDQAGRLLMTLGT